MQLIISIKVWYVDDSTSCGLFSSLLKWWDRLKALKIFHGSDVFVTRDGRLFQAVPLEQILLLLKCTCGHANYTTSDSIFCIILNRWMYLCRTCPKIHNCPQSLEHLIRLCLIPSLTERDAIDYIENCSRFQFVMVEWV